MQTNNHSNQKDLTANVHRPVLKVLGLGGGGCNAVTRMMELGLEGVEFIAANTDHQALAINPAPVKIQLGPKTTRGLGAGGDPRVGQEAAIESGKEIMAALQGADLVFLTAGMGGGTGTGSIPVAAEIARAAGAVTIAIVTTPFSFEMGRRQKNASEGLERLRKHTHTLIAIPNDRLLFIAPKNLAMETAFRLADDVLRQSVQGITEIITQPGMINVDFAHVRRLLGLGGGALMAIGHGIGASKTMQALEQALHHPLLETVSLDRAAGVIANFTGGSDLTLAEVNDAVTYLQSQTGNQTDIVLGVINDDNMDDRVQVILIITGLGAPTLEEVMGGVKRTAQKEAIPAQQLEPALNRASAAGPESHPARFSPLLHSAPEIPPASVKPAVPVVSAPIPAPEMVAASQNLDIPAFLRRRMSYS